MLATKNEHLLREGHLLEELLLLRGQHMSGGRDWGDGALEHRLLEDLAVVEAQTYLLLQHGGVVSAILLILLAHTLLMRLLGPPAEQAGQRVAIPTLLLLRAPLALRLVVTHHVGMVLADGGCGGTWLGCRRWRSCSLGLVLLVVQPWSEESLDLVALGDGLVGDLLRDVLLVLVRVPLALANGELLVGVARCALHFKVRSILDNSAR